MSVITILLIIMTLVASISIAFAISFNLDKRRLERKIERMNNTSYVDKRDVKMLANRERDLNLEVFRLKKKLRRSNKI